MDIKTFTMTDQVEDTPVQIRGNKSVTAADAEFLEMMAVDSSSVSDLHKSNLLRLQIEELLKETMLSMDPVDHHTAVGASAKWTTVLADYVQDVSRILTTQVSMAQVKILETSPSSPFTMRSDKVVSMTTLSTKHKLSVKLRGCSAANVGFTKPAGNAQVLPTLDLTVLIPTADLFEPKDHLRYRYFDKRNAVIWHVAQHLAQKKLAETVGKVYWRGSPDHPTLLLIPPIDEEQPKQAGKRAKVSNNDVVEQGNKRRATTKRLRFRVELHFGMDNIVWIQPKIRLLPNRCNISDAVSSHMYNYLLTRDASHLFMDDLSNHNHARTLKEETYPHWNQVVVSAKIWSLQRGILNRHDGFTVDHIALMLLFIYRTKLAGPRMETQQVLSSWFKLVAETDWLGEFRYHSTSATAINDKAASTTGHSNLIRKAPSEGYLGNQKPGRRTALVLPLEGKTMNQTIQEADMNLIYQRQTRTAPLTPKDPRTLLDLYETTYTLGPIFLDPSMTFNYLGGVSPSCIRLLQHEAKKGLEYLHSPKCTKSFSMLFMSDVRFCKRFDAYMRIPLENISFKASSSSQQMWGDDRNDLGDVESMMRGMMHVLRRALGDRITDIQIMSTGNGAVPAKVPLDGVHDSDEIPSYPVSDSASEKGREPKEVSSNQRCCPNGSDEIILGVSLNPDTCFRVVDRGPPADDLEETQQFLNLWGKEKAELRRFKDGAIVYAVVWDSVIDKSCEMKDGDRPFIRYQNDDRVQGGIVERIIRHILKLHFFRKKKQVTASFALRDILSTVDGVIPEDDKSVTFNPLVAHRMAMKAFEDLSLFLRDESLPSVSVPGSDKMNSRLGLPLPINAVEPLDPALRYAELFPPIPHPYLGGHVLPGLHKTSGVVCSDPIRIQIRFGSSSKWPTDLRAMGAAKTAMLIQLLDGIDELKRAGSGVGFEGRTVVTPEYADICYRGYVFRVLVRADPELKLLRELGKPSDEALTLLKTLTKKHVVASKHHSMMHAVYTSNPSSSMVVRATRRWISAHLFSGLIPFEALELIVAHIYTSADFALDAPGTLTSGLVRFFHLLASHDWSGEPLVVDPQGHLNDDDRAEIRKEFEAVRGPEGTRGPPMFIVAPYDRSIMDEDVAPTPAVSKTPTQPLKDRSKWRPTFTTPAPEAVVLGRARQLADRTYSYLCKCISGNNSSSGPKAWSSLFQESAESFRAYSALLRVGSDFVIEPETSSSASTDLAVLRNQDVGVWQSTYTRSMYLRYFGPKPFQIKVFKNLMKQQDGPSGVLLGWNPVVEMVEKLRTHFGEYAVFWYNDLCPEVVTVLWRPGIFSPKSFSAIASEYARPVTDDEWQKDTLATVSVDDIMREISCYTQDIVVDQKLLDSGMTIPPRKNPGTKRKRKVEQQPDSSSESSEEESSDEMDHQNLEEESEASEKVSSSSDVGQQSDGDGKNEQDSQDSESHSSEEKEEVNGEKEGQPGNNDEDSDTDNGSSSGSASS